MKQFSLTQAKNLRPVMMVLGLVILGDIWLRLSLDDLDNQILKAIIYKFNGGPVGIDTISAAVSEERATIEDVCEPYLMQIGFLSRTPRGRLATEAAYEHIGAAFPAKGEK